MPGAGTGAGARDVVLGGEGADVNDEGPEPVGLGIYRDGEGDREGGGRLQFTP